MTNCLSASTILRAPVASRKPRDGLTLIEVLIVIAIISLLMLLSLAAIQSAREAARQTACKENLRQIGLATQQFTDAYSKYPPGRWRSSSPTWFVLLLPYLEQQDLYYSWSLGEKYYSEVNKAPREVPLRVCICPSQLGRPLQYNAEDRYDAGGAPGDYAGNFGDFFPYRYDPKANGIITTASAWQEGQGPVSDMVAKIWDSDVTPADVLDGTSRTILAGEKLIRNRQTGKFPDDSSLYNGDHPHNVGRAGGIGHGLSGPTNDCVRASGCEGFGSRHPGVCQFVFADGSVHSLSTSIDTNVLGNLCNRKDGQAGEFLDR